jgi:hypothetical protein
MGKLYKGKIIMTGSIFLTGTLVAWMLPYIVTAVYPAARAFIA